MTYKTLQKRINAASERVNKASQGKHGYPEAIEAFEGTKELCRLMLIFLKKCESDNIPFEEYEIKLMEGKNNE